MEIVAEHGFAGITHRAVTDRAGLPIATVGYFFPSIDDLAEEAIQQVIREDIDAQQALAERLASLEATVDQVIAAFSHSSRARQPETAATIEALLRSARDERVRPWVEEAIQAARAVTEDGLRLVGVPDAKELAASVHALILGFALVNTALPDDLPDAALSDTLRTLLIGTLFEAGHEALARTVRDQPPGEQSAS